VSQCDWPAALCHDSASVLSVNSSATHTATTHSRPLYKHSVRRTHLTSVRSFSQTAHWLTAPMSRSSPCRVPTLAMRTAAAAQSLWSPSINCWVNCSLSPSSGKVFGKRQAAAVLRHLNTTPRRFTSAHVFIYQCGPSGRCRYLLLFIRLSACPSQHYMLFNYSWEATRAFKILWKLIPVRCISGWYC